MERLPVVRESGFIASILVISILLVTSAQGHCGHEERIEEVFRELKSGRVVDPEALIKKELSGLGIPVIKAMIRKLKKPRFDEIAHRVVENEDLEWACMVLSYMGEDAFTQLRMCVKLSKNVKKHDPFFRANILRAIFKCDRKESLDILADALTDTELSEKLTSIHERPPLRICDLAYGLLLVRLRSSGSPTPDTPKHFNLLPVEARDAEIKKLRYWWEENKAR